MSSDKELLIIHFCKKQPRIIQANHEYIVKPEGFVYRKDVIQQVQDNEKFNNETEFFGGSTEDYICHLKFHDGIEIGPFAFVGMQNIVKIEFMYTVCRQTTNNIK